MNLTYAEREFLGNCLDSHSTITAQLATRFDDYVYVVPQIIITTSNIRLVNAINNILTKLTKKEIVTVKRSTPRVVINGWQHCTAVLTESQPFLRRKIRHAEIILQLSKGRLEDDLLSSLSMLSLLQELLDLNKRGQRITFFERVITDRMKALSEFEDAETRLQLIQTWRDAVIKRHRSKLKYPLSRYQRRRLKVIQKLGGFCSSCGCDEISVLRIYSTPDAASPNLSVLSKLLNDEIPSTKYCLLCPACRSHSHKTSH